MTTRESLLKKIRPTLAFYFVASILIGFLYLNYKTPKNAHVPGFYQLALIALTFISAFLGFKNAMSSEKSSNLIVIIHTIALLVALLFLIT